MRVEDVTLQNSAFWQLVPYYSDDIVIRNIRVLAPANSPNTDAVDPFSSSNITIDHLYADVGDDDIAIKSGAINSPGGDQPSKNIHITDSTFLHGHGLSIGSEIAGGAQNVVAEGLTVDELRDRINAELGKFRREAQAYVIPVSYRSKRYYMLGAVAQKGVFALDRPITVIEAVAQLDASTAWCLCQTAVCGMVAATTVIGTRARVAANMPDGQLMPRSSLLLPTNWAALP